MGGAGICRIAAKALTGATPEDVWTRKSRSSPRPDGSRAPARSTTTGISRPDGRTKPLPTSRPSRPAISSTGSTSSSVSPNASKTGRFGSTHSSSIPGGIQRQARDTSGNASRRRTRSCASRSKGADSGPESRIRRGPPPDAPKSAPPLPRRPRCRSSPGRSTSSPLLRFAAVCAARRTLAAFSSGGRSSSSTSSAVMAAPLSFTSEYTTSTPSKAMTASSISATPALSAAIEARPLVERAISSTSSATRASGAPLPSTIGTAIMLAKTAATTTARSAEGRRSAVASTPVNRMRTGAGGRPPSASRSARCAATRRRAAGAARR